MKIQLIAHMVFLLVLYCPGVVLAQEENQERRAKPVLSNAIYRPMNKAQEAIQNEDYASALQILDEVLARGDRLSAYDRAKTLHLKTIVFIRQENYPAAVAACTDAIAQQALELETEHDLRYTLVRMLFVLERYDEALQELEAWLAASEQLDAEAAFTAAQLYLTVDQLPQARHYAEQGMTLHQADPAAAPRENWYRLLLSIYGQQKEYRKAAAVAQQTIALWPAKLEYYHQLSGLYQQLDRQKDAWAILDIAYHNELLTSTNDHLRLLQMHRFFGYPYRGAAVFSKAMEAGLVEKNEDHWENLANAWLQSRQWQLAENALIEAAQLSDAGQHWLRLCQTAFREQRWQQAEDYCGKALNKGGLEDDRAETWQLMAMVKYSSNQYSEAVDYFTKCAGETSAQNNDCADWLNHVNNLLTSQEDEKARAERQARLAEERRRNRDSLIDEALLMTE